MIHKIALHRVAVMTSLLLYRMPMQNPDDSLFDQWYDAGVGRDRLGNISCDVSGSSTCMHARWHDFAISKYVSTWVYM